MRNPILVLPAMVSIVFMSNALVHIDTILEPTAATIKVVKMMQLERDQIHKR